MSSNARRGFAGRSASAAKPRLVSALSGPASFDRAPLPSDTVTFAFTDIEGSTQRWERDPAAMQEAVRRHDMLVRAAIVEHNGVVFKTIGDAFCAAFRRPQDAVEAMLAAQRALAAHDLTAVDGIRVRAAIHTGTADERDGDYFGPVVNRVARLLSIGHGGQILVSGAARALAISVLPVDARLDDLGEHRLKDLSLPEHVFALVTPDRAERHPPLRSLDAHPNNLPTALTTFVGRDTEIAEVAALVDAHRVVTLVGTGGVGKTRISLQVAARFVDGTGDGVWFIEFAPLTSGDYLVATIANVLGLRLPAGGDPIQTLLERMAPLRTLLVFDNCEHIVEAVGVLTAATIRTCPYVKILASSRQALGIGGERTYRLPSLDVPPPCSPDVLSANQAGRFPAVALFVERARAVDGRFDLTDANATTVADICRRLDGIALAIELAAARVRILSPRQLHERLDERFRLLTGGSRDVLPRQQTLRALIDWSHDLLDDRERMVFRRLGIFVDAFSLEAACAVAGGAELDEFDVIDTLTSLVDKSLVLAQADARNARYSMLQSTRAYALERIAAAGERDSAMHRHATFYGSFIGDGTSLVISNAAALDAIETELDNLRAALQWALVERHDIGLGATLAFALGRYWSTRLPREGQRWLKLAQSVLADESSTALSARLASALAAMLEHGTYERIEATLHALHAARATSDSLILTKALAAYGEQLAPLGRGDEAQASFDEALEHAGRIDSDWDAGRALAGLGALAVDRDDMVLARALNARAIERFERVDASDGIAYVSITLAEAEFAVNLERAIELARRARRIHGELSNNRSSACAADLSAALAIAAARPDDARADARDALELLHTDRHPAFVTAAVEILAHVATLRGDPQRGATLQGYAQAEFGKLAHARARPAQWCYERHLHLLDAALGAEEAARCAAGGAVYAEDRAIQEALAV